MNKVYAAINRVQSDLCKTGIGKDSENKFDGYKFRGIDAVYNHLAPLLATHGLCVLPRMLARTCEERQSQKGGALFYVTVEAEFDLVCAEDGSKHTVRTYGEAMDRGDKATNKAMSAAYKYAAFQTFAIPTEGDNDADATTHDVRPQVTPTAGIWDALPEKRQAALLEMAGIVNEYIETGDPAGAWSYLTRVTLSTDEKAALWTRLDSKTRSAIKRAEKEAA